MITMPEPDRAVLARRAEIVAALRRIVPGEGVIDNARRVARLRMRRADRLPAAADGRRPSGHDGAGRRGPALLRGERGESRPARRRDIAVGRRPAARRRRPPRHGQVQPHPRDRRRQPLRRRPARRDQSRHHARRAGPRASITRPIRRARSPAPSAATSPRIRAACIASSTGLRPTTSSGSNS